MCANYILQPGNDEILSLTAREAKAAKNWTMARTIVLILDGNSGIGAQVRCNLCYLICLRGIRFDREQSQIVHFSPKRPIFLYT